MALEDLIGKRVPFSLDMEWGQLPKPLTDDTPEAADIIVRAELGDTGALIKILNWPVFVEDMPGNLARFNAGKVASGKGGGEGK